jgi:diacylglycerol O-acyltransferase
MVVCDPATAPGGHIGIEDISRLVGERLDDLPTFRWKLVQVPLNLDLPYWIEDPDFHLDFHIREAAVPPPGDPERVARTVARIFARPLDRSRPLWEMYLIHGLEHGHVALLTKVHHAVVDGVSGNEVLGALLDLEPTGRPAAPPTRHLAGEREPSDVEMLARGAAGLVRQPIRALRSAPRTLRGLTDLPGANQFPAVPTLSRGLHRARNLVGAHEDDSVLEVTAARPPATSFNRRISPYRSFAFGSVPLDTIKAIKNAAHTTVNDVVVTLAAAAVRAYLLDRDELPDDPLVALIPVSVRTEEERGEFGNRVSTMIVPIPTDEPDPRHRLVRTHDLLRSAKDHHQALPASLLTDATAFIPPALAARSARTTVSLLGRLKRPPVNLIISNVPGPPIPLYCAGAALQALYPVSAIVDGVGLNITVLSYRDHVDFGIIADREQIDDAGAWTLWERIRGALDELASRYLGGDDVA